jgi:uncharacterized protein DUF2399
VAGQIVVASQSATFHASEFSGPVILRTGPAELVLTLQASARALVLVENLQAGEMLADVHTDLAIVYTGGMPGHETLDQIGRLAEQAETTLIATDADLGGIRIAEQLLTVAPAALVLDVGTAPHEPQPAWPVNSGYRRAIEKSLAGSASMFAKAVLARGYPLEQELLLLDAIPIALPSATTTLAASSTSTTGQPA